MGRASRRLSAVALSAAPAAGALLHGRRALRAANIDRGEQLGAARIASLVEPLYSRPEPPRPGTGPVTAELFARLTEEDIAGVEAALEGPAHAFWNETPPDERQWLTLVLIAHYRLAGAMGRTGLTDVQPPDDVHAMGRGPFAAGGDPASADLVVTALGDAGFALDDGARVLDFGCSSGRVLRALAAWRPQVEWLGCDPNGPAVAWADAHLPMARFFASGTTPPLELDDASVDVAFAISIWSHFDAGSALAWLTEMHRVVVPGGALLLTFHGLDSLSGFLRGAEMSDISAAETVIELLRGGHQFYDVFGDDGDWGVSHPGWGNAYASLMWLARAATPQWSIRHFREGALAANQDILVLERREP